MTPITDQERETNRQLTALTAAVTEASGKVTALHDQLLGELGHVKQIYAHIDRLYDKNKELVEANRKLETLLLATMRPSANFIESIKGGWRVLVVLAVLIGEGVRIWLGTRGGK